MDEVKAWVIAAATILIAGAVVISVYNWTEAMVSQEAIKAGLIQKVEQNRTIWAKP